MLHRTPDTNLKVKTFIYIKVTGLILQGKEKDSTANRRQKEEKQKIGEGTEGEEREQGGELNLLGGLKIKALSGKVCHL